MKGQQELENRRIAYKQQLMELNEKIEATENYAAQAILFRLYLKIDARIQELEWVLCQS